MAIRILQEKIFVKGKYGAFLKHYMREGIATPDKDMGDKSANFEEMSSGKETDSKGKEPAP